MNENLVINPCLHIHKLNDLADEYFVLSPVPGKGLQRLNIAKSEDPEIYKTIDEIAKMGTNFVDPAADLSDETRAIFRKAGVLIEKESEPVMPLFACQLSEIPVRDIPEDIELKVNGSLRYDPVDFTKLNEWMYKRHLLPTQPVAWIRNPVTGIESGFWLTPEQAAIVLQMEPDAVVKTPGRNDETLRRLFTAGVVDSEYGFQTADENWRRKIGDAAIEFEEMGYTVVRDLLPPCQLNALQKFYAKYVSQGFMEFGDAQVDKRYWQLNEAYASSLHHCMTEIMKGVAGEEIKPSYCFAASYVEGADLKPHIDREQCEYSVSLQVDFQPGTADGKSPWALSLFRPKSYDRSELFGWEVVESSGPTVEKKDLFLKNGDGLFYRGRELVHYRRSLDDGCTSTSIFLHYVRQDFAGSLY